MEAADNELLRLYAEEGSQEAFAELVAKQLNIVHSAAMRQTGGDYHRARDVTQQVFVSLARKAPSLCRHPSLTGWLYTSVFYEASKMKRTESRRESRLKGATAMTEIVNIGPMADWSQLSAVLDAAMLELGTRDRDAVLWRFFEGNPLAVVGSRLGISEDTARKRVQRALERMRRSLRRKGLDSSIAALAVTLAENAAVAAPAGLAETVTTKALAIAGAAGETQGTLRRLLRHSRAGVHARAAFWASGILTVGATITAGGELWIVHKDQANLSADEQTYQADKDLLRKIGPAPTTLPSSTSSASSSAGIARRGSRADFQAFLRDYPQSKEILMDNGRVLAHQLFGSFFRKAALSPGRIKQTEDALAEYWIQGEVLSPKEFALTGKTMPPEDQLRPILGDKDYRQFQDYQQSAFAHHWAAQAARQVPGELALSADQVDQLAQAIDGAAGKSLGDEADLATLDWNAIRAQIQARLSTAQWDGLGPILEALRANSLQRSVKLSLSNSNP